MKLLIINIIFLLGFVGVIFGEPITITFDLSPLQSAALRNLAIRTSAGADEVASNEAMATQLLKGLLDRQASQLRGALQQEMPQAVEASVAEVASDVNERLMDERREQRAALLAVRKAKDDELKRKAAEKVSE